MRRNLKLAGLAALAGLGLGLAGCVAYPVGPDEYVYRPAYGYAYYGPYYYGPGYYAPGYVSGSYFYYDAPHRYWRSRPYYRGPWHGGPHDFGDRHGPRPGYHPDGGHRPPGGPGPHMGPGGGGPGSGGPGGSPMQRPRH
ncbi:hypothetical protein [Parvibaculum sp.]|uniref:hypothetical protein n=1 Tax=Parvibaculum sp. TaxID=2024848 RepID=UPI0032112FE4